MADPFQNVDAAGAEFIKVLADSMDVRQSDPAMERIVATYLGMLEFAGHRLTIEIGAGAGAVTRRIAARAAPGRVIGFDPSQGFVDEAKERAGDHANLSFQRADGAALPLEDASVDAAIMHTVLTHVTDPAALISEACRVLKPGGALVICDAGFSKATLAGFPDDPLDCCARAFVRDFVTDAFLVGKLRGLITGAGLKLDHFGIDSRVVVTREQMLPWVELTTKAMLERGEIGEALAEALRGEMLRRADAGSLYGYQAFATALARKA